MTEIMKGNQEEAEMNDEMDKMKDNGRLRATRSRHYERCPVYGVEKQNF